MTLRQYDLHFLLGYFGFVVVVPHLHILLTLWCSHEYDAEIPPGSSGVGIVSSSPLKLPYQVAAYGHHL